MTSEFILLSKGGGEKPDWNMVCNPAWWQIKRRTQRSGIQIKPQPQIRGVASGFILLISEEINSTSLTGELPGWDDTVTRKTLSAQNDDRQDDLPR